MLQVFILVVRSRLSRISSADVTSLYGDRLDRFRGLVMMLGAEAAFAVTKTRDFIANIQEHNEYLTKLPLAAPISLWHAGNSFTV